MVVHEDVNGAVRVPRHEVRRGGFEDDEAGPLALIAGMVLLPFAWLPALSTLTRSVVVALANDGKSDTSKKTARTGSLKGSITRIAFTPPTDTHGSARQDVSPSNGDGWARSGAPSARWRHEMKAPVRPLLCVMVDVGTEHLVSI